MKRWVKLNEEWPTLVKCLNCGWRWSSTCQYVSELNIWKERSRKGLTDAGILEKINAGELVVDIEHAIAYSNGKELAVTTRSRGDNGNRGCYRFVKICWQGKQKKIALHRLVWMFASKQLIPDWADVDHINGSAAGDGIGNLMLLRKELNRGNHIPPDF